MGRLTLKNLLPLGTDSQSSRETNRDEESITPIAESIDVWATSHGSKNRYYILDPLVRLIGKSDEITIIIDGKRYMALIDSGAQDTTITVDLVNKIKLPIYGLQTLYFLNVFT